MVQASIFLGKSRSYIFQIRKKNKNLVYDKNGNEYKLMIKDN